MPVDFDCLPGILYAASFEDYKDKESPAKEEKIAIEAILNRLSNEDIYIFRSGGRAVIIQAILNHQTMIKTLRGEIPLVQEKNSDEYRRGYLDALEDSLLAAEAVYDIK